MSLTSKLIEKGTDKIVNLVIKTAMFAAVIGLTLTASRESAPKEILLTVGHSVNGECIVYEVQGKDEYRIIGLYNPNSQQNSS